MKHNLFILKILQFSDYIMLMWGKIPGSPTFRIASDGKLDEGWEWGYNSGFLYIYLVLYQKQMCYLLHEHIIMSFLLSFLFLMKAESLVGISYIISASNHIEASLTLKMWVEVASENI